MEMILLLDQIYQKKLLQSRRRLLQKRWFELRKWSSNFPCLQNQHSSVKQREFILIEFGLKHFAKETKSLINQGAVPTNSPILKLNSFLDDSSILRMGNYLRESSLSYGIQTFHTVTWKSSIFRLNCDALSCEAFTCWTASHSHFMSATGSFQRVQHHSTHSQEMRRLF